MSNNSMYEDEDARYSLEGFENNQFKLKVVEPKHPNIVEGITVLVDELPEPLDLNPDPEWDEYHQQYRQY